MTDTEINNYIENLTDQEIEEKCKASIRAGVNIRLALDIHELSEELSIRYIKDCYLKSGVKFEL